MTRAYQRTPRGSEIIMRGVGTTTLDAMLSTFPDWPSFAKAVDIRLAAKRQMDRFNAYEHAPRQDHVLREAMLALYLDGEVGMSPEDGIVMPQDTYDRIQSFFASRAAQTNQLPPDEVKRPHRPKSGGLEYIAPLFSGPEYRQATREEHIANVEAILDGPIVKDGAFIPFGAPEHEIDRDPKTGKLVVKTINGDRS